MPPQVSLHWEVGNGIERRIGGDRLVVRNHSTVMARASLPFSHIFNFVDINVQSVPNCGKIMVGILDARGINSCFVASDGTFWKNGSLVGGIKSFYLTSSTMSITMGNGMVVFSINSERYTLSVTPNTYTPYIFCNGFGIDILTKLNPYLVRITGIQVN